MEQRIKEFLAAVLPENKISYKEPMSRHTSFRVGGAAACFLQITEAEQLKKLIPYFTENSLPYFIVGNGSNLLVSDEGYDGIILKIESDFDKIVTDGCHLHVQAGALLSKAAKAACEAGLTGMEFASGIPGSIGGGVVMNAGAYDGEMKQIVESVSVVTQNGGLKEIPAGSMEFGYRTSILKKNPWVMTQVTLLLKQGCREEIQKRMDELNARRREKQPLEYPSAGSTFKRPEGYYAGKLIMDCGLSGYTVGGAQVSEKHCGFVINRGNATASEINQLMRDVQKQVKDKFNVLLEPEVIRLGKFLV